MKLLICIAASFLLLACSAYRSAIPDEPVPLPQQFAAQQSMSDEANLPWWETIKDPQLERLLKEVHLGSPSLKAAWARLKQNLALEVVAGARLRPFVNLNAQAGRESVSSGATAQAGNRYGLSLAAGYELDLWNRLQAGTMAAQLDAEASADDLRAIFLALSARAADLYFLALEQSAQLRLTDETLLALKQTMELVTERYEAGLVSALDLFQARQSLATFRATRPTLELNLSKTLHALALLAGQAPGELELDLQVNLPESLPTLPPAVPADLLEQRPDLRAAFSRLKAQDHRIAQAIAERLPAINLLATLGRTHSNASVGGVTATVWSLLAEATAPLIDGGRRRAEVLRSRARFEEVLADYQATVLGAVKDVEDALVSAKGTAELMGLLDEQRRAAMDTYEIAFERYTQGLIDYLPVLSSYSALLGTRSQLLSARRQLISDRIALARALGGGWMPDPLARKDDARQGLEL